MLYTKRKGLSITSYHFFLVHSLYLVNICFQVVEDSVNRRSHIEGKA